MYRRYSKKDRHNSYLRINQAVIVAI